jgi:hypothetical protein
MPGFGCQHHLKKQKKLMKKPNTGTFPEASVQTLLDIKITW